MTTIPFLQFSSKMQASDRLTPQEANVNNNNSLVAPIRGLEFGGFRGKKGIVSPSTSLNLQSRSASTGKFENGSSMVKPLRLSSCYAIFLQEKCLHPISPIRLFRCRSPFPRLCFDSVIGLFGGKVQRGMHTSLSIFGHLLGYCCIVHTDPISNNHSN